MQWFDLTIIAKATNAVFAQLPEADQPYGSFGKGDSIDWNGIRYDVEEVRHAIVATPPGPLCRTALVVSPYAPHALAEVSDSIPWPLAPTPFQGGQGAQIYEGLGATLDAAMTQAHNQIPVRQGRDFTLSRVVDWGMQLGGLTQQRRYYVRLVEDLHGQFRSDGPERDSA